MYPKRWQTILEEMVLQDTTYRDQSKIFLEKAFRELEEGDLLQASEKGWGAAAQMVKAVAVEWGWEHRSHNLLFAAVDKMASETGNDQFIRLFSGADSLHKNFYEGHLSSMAIATCFDQVRLFIEMAEDFLNSAKTAN